MRMLSLLLLLGIGCAGAEVSPRPAATPPQQATVHQAAQGPAAAPTAVPEAPAAVATGGRRLLFFLNPEGRPCQMQRAILEELGDDLTSVVAVEQVSVLDANNRPVLYQYGIRSLPALILVDAEGGELHRFTPGIQPAATSLAALD